MNNDNSITWNIEANEVHADHIEMSGLYNSSIVHYATEKGELDLSAHLVFPMLRTIPNNTHGSLAFDVELKSADRIRVNGQPVNWKATKAQIDGILHLYCLADSIELHHHMTASTDRQAFVHSLRITNRSSSTKKVAALPQDSTWNTEKAKGVDGVYNLRINGEGFNGQALKPGASVNFGTSYFAKRQTEPDQYISVDYELRKREAFCTEMHSSLVFNSPDPILNTMFQMAKVRVSESIYQTKGGLMHGPGGGRYYAAIWANDQAEYANPFFPLLDNANATESAINSFKHFARFMNDDYKPIPSSIVAEGIDIWNGAGDRGDMAMIAYGASRFALSYGDAETARQLWPLIEWCLEYCNRNLNDQGVVNSDCDELERRFPAGDANLNTSCLYYDALLSSAFLLEDIDLKSNHIQKYTEQAITLRKSIDAHFGANMQGFETYRYFDGNSKLRSWICTPLTVDIFDRAEQTTQALFSKDLWTDDGLATEQGSTTFWDRSTLYGLRGVFAAGYADRAYHFMHEYSKRRLLGDHVPYAVEAYPEGNQRHLSAESALYCRMVTEGIFGMRPTGLRSFRLKPSLPADWDNVDLKNTSAHGELFDISIERIDGENLRVKIHPNEGESIVRNIIAGESINIQF